MTRAKQAILAIRNDVHKQWQPIRMGIHSEQNTTSLFSIHEPTEYLAPVLFNVPHAGQNYTQDFLESSRLAPLTLRRSEDAHVDRLYEGVIKLGAPLMVVHFPRAYLDVNREPFELDPRLFLGKLPDYANVRSARVAAGLGTVPRIVANGQEIYTDRLPLEEGLWRIENFHVPYHRALRELMENIMKQFGVALLIDCHSMPRLQSRSRREPAPDIVLGDRFGMSCAPAIINYVGHALQQRGYRVSRNRPYAGGYITEHYGEPASGWHALQIEVSRTLYMDEATLEPSQNFVRLAQDLVSVSAGLIRTAVSLLPPVRTAAE